LFNQFKKTKMLEQLRKDFEEKGLQLTQALGHRHFNVSTSQEELVKAED
jgi:hypothetical protein